MRRTLSIFFRMLFIKLYQGTWSEKKQMLWVIGPAYVLVTIVLLIVGYQIMPSFYQGEALGTAQVAWFLVCPLSTSVFYALIFFVGYVTIIAKQSLHEVDAYYAQNIPHPSAYTQDISSVSSIAGTRQTEPALEAVILLEESV